MTATDNIVEDESDDGPRDVVDSRGRGDSSGSGEDDGEAKDRDKNMSKDGGKNKCLLDVTEHGVGPLEGDQVDDGGESSADEEEEDESVVDLALRELTSRTNHTPLKPQLDSRSLT